MQVALALPGLPSDTVELELLRAGHRIAWRAVDRDGLLEQLAATVPDVVLVADDPAVATTEVVGACDLLGVRTCLVRADDAGSATARLLGVHDILRVVPGRPIDLAVLSPAFDAFDGGIADSLGAHPGFGDAVRSAPGAPHGQDAPPPAATDSEPHGEPAPWGAPHRIDPIPAPADGREPRRRSPRIERVLRPRSRRRAPDAARVAAEPAATAALPAAPAPAPASRPVAEPAPTPAPTPAASTSAASPPDPGTPPHRVIAVWGPAGAPGRTTIAITLAAELAARGHRVCLVDADTYGGTIAPALGLLDEAPGFAAACRLAANDALDAGELDRVALTYGGTAAPFRVLTGIGRPHRWPELSRDRVTRTLEAARLWSEVVVIDTGFNLETDEEVTSDLLAPRRNAATIAALRAADDVVVIGAADPVGLARLLRTHADLLDVVTTDRVHVVANRVRASVLGVDPAGQVRQTLDRFGGIADPVLVADDPNAADAALLSARTVVDVAPRSALRTGCAAIADRLDYGLAGGGARRGRGRGLIRPTG